MSAQNIKLDAFFAKHKQHPNTIALAIPGWLVKFGVNISEDKEDVDEYRPLLRGLSHLKVLVMEGQNYASQKEVKQLVANVRKLQFIDLISVKDGGTSVHILVKEKKTKKGTFIKNVMILVAEKDELVLVTLNGRWNKNFLQKALKDGEVDFLGGLASVERETKKETIAEL